MMYPELSLHPGVAGHPAQDAPFETKFLIPRHLAGVVGAWARAHLRPDPHATGPAGAYRVSSLYFDSPAWEIYRRGELGDADKYRIRRYGAEDLLYLECKSKRAGRVVKRRTPVPARELRHVEGLELPPGWSGLWFAEALAQRRLRPVCHVSYLRHAWLGEMDGQPVRLTLDQELRCGGAEGLETPGADAERLPLCDGCILEIKFAASLPGSFRRWMGELGCEAQAHSKYRRAAQVCGIAPA